MRIFGWELAIKPIIPEGTRLMDIADIVRIGTTIDERNLMADGIYRRSQVVGKYSRYIAIVRDIEP